MPRNSLTLENVQLALKRRNVLWTRHAVHRMRSRRIKRGDVLKVIESGVILEKHVKSTPYPKCLMMGFADARRPLVRSMDPKEGVMTELQRCPSCGSMLVEGFVTHQEQDDQGGLMIIRNVPAFVCSQCGEYLLSDEVLEQLDTLLETAQPTQKIETPVYDFTTER